MRRPVFAVLATGKTIFLESAITRFVPTFLKVAQGQWLIGDFKSANDLSAYLGITKASPNQPALVWNNPVNANNPCGCRAVVIQVHHYHGYHSQAVLDWLKQYWAPDTAREDDKIDSLKAKLAETKRQCEIAQNALKRPVRPSYSREGVRTVWFPCALTKDDILTRSNVHLAARIFTETPEQFECVQALLQDAIETPLQFRPLSETRQSSGTEPGSSE